MDSESELIRRNIEVTREDLAENLGALENKVKGVVSNVKNASKNINPIHQAENHPLLAVGVSLAAGAVLGTLLGREKGSSTSGQSGESLFKRIVNSSAVRQFEDEISMIKNMAIGVGIKRAATAAKNAFPAVGHEIDSILESAEDKLGLRNQDKTSSREASRL